MNILFNKLNKLSQCISPESFWGASSISASRIFCSKFSFEVGILSIKHTGNSKIRPKSATFLTVRVRHGINL